MYNAIVRHKEWAYVAGFVLAAIIASFVAIQRAPIQEALVVEEGGDAARMMTDADVAQDTPIEDTAPADYADKNADLKYHKIEDGVVQYYGYGFGSPVEIPEADPNTFQELVQKYYHEGVGQTRHWAKDKNHVYREGKKQDHIDAATAVLYDWGYVGDASGVWLYTGTGTGQNLQVHELNADPATFSTFGIRYSKDAQRVYYGATELAGADPQSFVTLRADKDYTNSNWYAKDAEHVYFDDSLIPDADAPSFTYLDDGYAKDQGNVYYNGTLLADADAYSFSAVKNYGNDVYAVDKDHVFSGSDILDLDPSSFEVLGDRMIKDSQGVYYREYNTSPPMPIQGADAQSFQHIGECVRYELSYGTYYRDKNHIYIGHELAEPLDAATFEYYGSYNGFIGPPYSISYARDKNAVYHSCGIVMEDADLATFQNIRDGYAKDNDTVWFLGHPINGADIGSFRVFTDGYAKDATSVFFSGDVIEDADVASFEIVNEQASDGTTLWSYGKDAYRVYSYGQVIEGADPKDCVPQDITACHPKPQP